MNEHRVFANSVMIKEGKVNIESGNLNIRQGYSTQSSVLGKLTKGMTVEVIGTRGEWLQIKSNNITGWVHGDFLTITEKTVGQNPTSPANESNERKGKVKVVGSLNMRTEPSAKGKIIDQLKNEQSILIYDENKGWYKIKAGNKIGWVHGDYVEVEKTNTNPTKPPSQPTPSEPSNQTPIIYTVQKGDSLWSISKKYETTIEKIKKLNKLTNNIVHVGQKLIVGEEAKQPNPTEPTNPSEPTTNESTYTVQNGDTLWSVAKKFGLTVEKIKELNQLTSDVINKGDVLKIKDITYGKVTASVLNVRSESSTTGKIIGKLSLNAIVEISKEEKNWYLIKTEELTGWVSGDFITIVTNVDPTIPTSKLKEKIIVIDPGHGGDDPGSVGIDGVTWEHQVNLWFSKKIKSELENQGATVYMIREGNTSCDNLPKNKDNKELWCRAKFADKVKADIFISIHANAYYLPSAKGMETYYDSSMNDFPQKSELLANEIHQKIITTINTNDRKIKDNDYYVLRHNTVPAVLIETGFVSSPNDLSQLKNPAIQQKFAEQLTLGVISYFEKTE